jgi:REP element-mobilizing transposase RayT
MPHNPGLRELVENKRKWSSKPQTENAKRGFRGWHERGFLPHRDEPGLIQFVTFRLTDSFPAQLRSEWEQIWMTEDDRERHEQIETYLDKGRGACHLRRADLAQLVEDNFRQFAGTRYELRAWMVMPNHVHVLFKVGAVPMSEIIGAWKRHTARRANEILGTRGAFWSKDYFDTFIQDAEHELKSVHYIENNPVKAKLILDPRQWRWSSARYRDEFGRLKYP